MCEFCEVNRKTASVKYFSSHPDSMIARSVMELFPYAFRPNCCPRCGKKLQPWEQRPQGKATRCMCVDEYNAFVPNNVGSYECIICGGRLEGQKNRDQYSNPREISNHIHDGKCMHLWTIIHNVSIGEPDVTAMFDAYLERPQSYAQLPSPRNWMPKKTVFQRHRVPKALPPPTEQLRYEPENRVMREKVPIISGYKGKMVRRISEVFGR
jgi:hypothetical protein